MEEKQTINTPIYYTNDTGLEVSNVDMKLIINYRSGNDDTRKLCEIIFTHEHGKNVIDMFNKALNKTEGVENE